MIPEIASGVFRLQVPVPFRLGHVHLYLVDVGDGFVLVDTGLVTAEAVMSVDQALKEVGIEPAQISCIIVTHFHADHAGQAARVQKLSGAPVVMGKQDAAYIDQFFRTGPPSEAEEFFLSHGVPALQTRDFFQILPALASFMTPFSADRVVGTGEEIGSRRKLVGLPTPGHTPGHLCVYLPEEGILFGGDHILPHITPNIGLYSSADPNPLGSYLSSLRGVLTLAPRRIFPAHGPEIEDPEGRIWQLLEHHRQRLDRILSATLPAGRTAWEVSRLVFGEDMDPVEQWMAFSETLAHLEYLVSQRTLGRFQSGSHVVYCSP